MTPEPTEAPEQPLHPPLPQVLARYFRRHPDQVYLWRREGGSFVLEDYNDEVERMTGGAMRRFVGRPATEIGQEAPEALEAMERAWREDRVVPVELHYRFLSTGEWKDLHLVYVPVPPTHLIAHAVDLTDIMEDARSLRERGEALEAHRERLQALAAYQDRVREEERIRLSRELHDELGQRLTVLYLDLQRALEATEPPLRRELEAVAAGLGEALDVTRELSRRLRPSVLDELGLPAALEWQLRHLGQRLDVETTFELASDEPALDASTAAGLFRIAQEALTNAARHANPSRVRVRLGVEDGQVVLEVRDDGEGFDASDPQDGLGLVTMQERATALQGTLVVESRPGQGCTVEARVPLHRSDPG